MIEVRTIYDLWALFALLGLAACIPGLICAVYDRFYYLSRKYPRLFGRK